MELRKGLEISSSDFWYDLTDGGYLNPHDICEHNEDALRVEQAINVIREFQNACEEQIEDFIQ